MKRVLLIAFAVLILFIAFELLTLPNVESLATEHPRTTAFMEQRREELADAGKPSELAYQWVPFERISPYLRRGVLVAEDDGFYQHDGVDMDSMKEALATDLKRKKLAFGGSTITQQLARNLYLSPSKNPLRKIKEIIIAKRLEKALSKKRILEIYLNVVEMGERVYGAEAASRYYFHKPARDLNPQQAALLAGCLPNPRIMVPDKPSKRLRARQRMILSRMRRWGYLFERQVLADKKPVPQAPPPPDTAIEPVPIDAPAETATETASETASVPSVETSATSEEPSTESSAPTATTESSPPQ